jgi:thioredoxin reductase
MTDVVIIGGGAAGLSAALVLGRARRNVLVLDAGQPRNAPASAAHGVFTREGTPPLELLRIARDQLSAYPSIEVREGVAASVHAGINDFHVTTVSGERIGARKLLLAYGLADSLPEIAGIGQFWGESVLHCPYCHGWEVRDEPLAYIANGAMATEFGALLLGWSRDLVLCTNGPADLTDEQREQLSRNGVQVREQRIISVEGEGRKLRGVRFEDGTVLFRSALFVRPAVSPRTNFSVVLGCEHTEAGFIKVDELGRTSVPGVFAAGDLVTPFQQVIRAAATGATAAAGINHSLAGEDFARASREVHGEVRV